MINVAQKLKEYKAEIEAQSATLVAISKTKPSALIQEAYDAGQRHFGENKAQELKAKAEELPPDIQWHMVGHLQRNKIKYIAQYVYLIHSVDSLKLLEAINKEAIKNNRTINVLLQVHIAREETKFGLSKEELVVLLKDAELAKLQNISIAGLMGMATNTADTSLVSKEFASLKATFDRIKEDFFANNGSFCFLSMGMSGDYQLALAHGSTMVRIGSAIFGARNYE
ncbi:MAG: YggS family pyridoxal phosphate-dependent enzyme [Cyclobacteriaceae bacterium]|nr:YggS family pyridoxal phosphate-dependent enzyme [Cyclobacteriaceae bacterium HetDA_MAG_MS6]